MHADGPPSTYKDFKTYDDAAAWLNKIRRDSGTQRGYILDKGTRSGRSGSAARRSGSRAGSGRSGSTASRTSSGRGAAPRNPTASSEDDPNADWDVVFYYKRGGEPGHHRFGSRKEAEAFADGFGLYDMHGNVRSKAAAAEPSSSAAWALTISKPAQAAPSSSAAPPTSTTPATWPRPISPLSTPS
jgi:hypothetical protein